MTAPPTARPALPGRQRDDRTWPASTSGPASRTCPGGTADWTFTDVTGNYNDPRRLVAIVISKADADCSSISGYSGVYDGTAHGATGYCLAVNGTTHLAGLDLGASFTNVPGGTADWAFTDVTGNYNDTGRLRRDRHQQGRRRLLVDQRLQRRL